MTNRDRVEHRADLVEVLERALAREDAATWVRRLGDAGIAAGQVNDIGAALAYAERLGLQPTVDLGGDHPPQVRHPISWSRSDLPPPTPPPSLGQHTAEVRIALQEHS